jgi:hypothetical protein
MGNFNIKVCCTSGVLEGQNISELNHKGHTPTGEGEHEHEHEDGEH